MAATMHSNPAGCAIGGSLRRWEHSQRLQRAWQRGDPRQWRERLLSGAWWGREAGDLYGA